MDQLPGTDLILNDDGSLYHINLLPGDIAPVIITVGDPERVAMVSKYFDEIELKKAKREFTTHTGRIGNKRLTVISTGIGTDNIDIVLNELDALVNIDLKTRRPNPVLKSLDIIRIGTSGALQPGIPVDSLLISSAAIGLDTLMHYYKHETTINDQQLLTELSSIFPVGYPINPYFASANRELLTFYAGLADRGITLTAPGFYSPQGRETRVMRSMPDLISLLQNFESSGRKIANLEMETAGIYGLSACMGHRAISFNIILANRATGQFSKYPTSVMDAFIQKILDKVS